VSITSVSTLRLVNTRSNTCSMYNAGISIATLSSRLAPPASITKGRKRFTNSQFIVHPRAD
jgi:hypothetical protein